MKKRFKNILTRSPKKNGLLFCICAICITLISGMLIGCSVTKNDSSDESAQIINDSSQESVPAENDSSGELSNTDSDTANSGLEDHTNTQMASTDHSGTDISNDTQNGNMENPSELSSESMENDYKSILLGQTDFICTDLANRSLNIREIGQAVTDDDSVTVSATKFAMIDIDGDGNDETVLRLQINGISDYGFEILHNQNGEIYGYTLPYREFMNLKTDGTFLFSGGAADSGIGKMNLSETGYKVNSQAHSQSGYDSNNELTVQYFINDEACSEDEFNDVINDQEQKTDVEWYDLSENNINAVL